LGFVKQGLSEACGSARALLAPGAAEMLLGPAAVLSLPEELRTFWASPREELAAAANLPLSACCSRFGRASLSIAER